MKTNSCVRDYMNLNLVRIARKIIISRCSHPFKMNRQFKEFLTPVAFLWKMIICKRRIKIIR